MRRIVSAGVVAAVGLCVLLLAFPAFAGEAAAGGVPGSLKEALGKGWGWGYLFVFGAGIGSCFTPCVYPLVAVTVSIFGGGIGKVSRLRSFGLSGLYTLGMAVTMSVLGLLAGLAGGVGLGAYLNKWYVIWPLVLLFLVLAASMFGAFELTLPQSLSQKLNRVGGAGPWGAFLMGLAAGLIALPCTGPVLVGILAFIGIQGNPAVGVTLLITYALGFGLTFWLVATFSMWLPKSGPWMEAVKSVFGIILCAVAVYFIEIKITSLRKIQSPEWWFLVGSLALVGIGVAIGALHLSFKMTDKWSQRIRKGFGIALCTIGIMGVVHYWMAPKAKVKSRSDFKVALKEAKKQRKHVIMDFWASYCAPCLKMDKKTFGDPRIAKLVKKKFQFVKIDCGKDTPRIRALRKKYNAIQLPVVVILGPDQKLVKRLAGYTGPDKMLKALQEVK